MGVTTLETANRTARECFERAKAAIERKNLDYAIEMLCEAVNAEPNWIKARELLRAVQVKRASAGAFARLMSTAKIAPLLTKAKMQISRNPIEAMSLAEQALNLDPRNPQALLTLAEASQAAHFPETSIQVLELYLKLSPNDTRALHFIASIYRELHQYEPARDIYDRLLEINPNDFEAQRAIKDSTADGAMHGGGWKTAESYRDVIKDKDEAVALEQQSRVVRAEDMTDNLIHEKLEKLAVDPNSSVIRRELGRLYVQKGDFETGMRYLQAILETEGSDASLEREIAAIRTKQLATALDEKKRQLAAKPAPDIAAALEKEITQLQRELDKAAVEEAQRLVERYPNDLLYRFDLGVLYMKVADHKNAIEQLQRAVGQPQKRVASLNFLGQCFEKLGLNDLAIEQYQKAIEESPMMDGLKKDLIYHLGCAYEKAGDTEKAITEFKKIAVVDFGYRDVRDKITRKPTG